MKLRLTLLLLATLPSVILAAPFGPAKPEEHYGVGSTVWRFASNLTHDATGMIEICYSEVGSATRVLGRVELRPFRSSEAASPDLRILFTTAEVDGKKRVLLLVGYGIRSGVFIVDVPGLTTHSLAGGNPVAGASGEINLLAFAEGNRGPTFRHDGSISGEKGRLFFRYIEKS